MDERRDLWTVERACWAEGYGLICGCDEAGAGPLAGAVYAAAVLLPFGLELPGLDDSKKLTEKKREALFPVIQERAVAWAVARAEPEEIDAIRAQRAADEAREAILQKRSAQEYRMAQANLARALNRLRVKSENSFPR